MAPRINTNALAFALDFRDSIWVAGEIIAGCVHLNVACAQDDSVETLCVNLKGFIITKVVEHNADGSRTMNERTIELLNTTRLLWERGSALPDPGSHILSLPFQFRLPTNIPPSFDLSVLHHGATISYTIEVLGIRPGRLRKNREIRRSFTVLPAASLAQILAKKILEQGWDGPWRTFFLERKIRQGIWGDYGYVRAEVKIPDLESFPCATAMPLWLYVETRTKTMAMARTSLSEDKSRKLFPAPPTDPADVSLYFHREAKIRTLRRNGSASDSFRIKGSLGDPTSTSVVCHKQDTEWISDRANKDRGVWKRAVSLETTVPLPFTPTFTTETVDCRYSLRFTISFPGVGNDLKIQLPIHLDPVHICGSPPSWSPEISYAEIPPENLFPLEEPPSYWESNNVNRNLSDQESNESS